jgi:hypothetical protein
VAGKRSRTISVAGPPLPQRVAEVTAQDGLEILDILDRNWLVEAEFVTQRRDRLR